MPLQKILFKPGVNRENTRYTTEGGWYECDKIRFRQGTPEVIGGWQRISSFTYQGVCRSLWNWITLANLNLVGVGTNLKFYIESGGAYNDVTPIRRTVTLTNPFVLTASTTVTVNDTNHGCTTGSFVTFSGATAIGAAGTNVTAAVLNREFQITFVDADKYTITISVTPNPTAILGSPGGGASVSAAYQVNAGSSYEVPLTGWGAGAWGYGTWGNGSTSATSLQLWNQINYGQDLLYGPRGGGLYYWSATDGLKVRGKLLKTELGGAVTFTNSVLTGLPTEVTPAVAYTDGAKLQFNTAGTMPAGVTAGITYRVVLLADGFNFNLLDPNDNFVSTTSTGAGVYVSDIVDAPLFQNVLTVSDTSRFTIVFGTNDYGSTTLDPMLIRWSDKEDVYNWTPSVTNQAGSIRLSHGSQIITAVQTRQEIVVFTDASVYSMQYLGPPYVWQTQLLGDNISIASPNAAIIASGVVYWMGVDKFYLYDGRTQTLNCDLRKYVFSDINLGQSQQIFCSTNEGFNEVWWFYCSITGPTGTGTAANPNLFIDRYVVFNYAEQIWYYGTMARTAWIDSGLRDYPLAATYYNNLVNHEQGINDNATTTTTAINAYISSSEFDIGDGHNFGFVWRVLPDLTFDNSTSAPNGNLAAVTMTLYGLSNSGSGVTSDALASVKKSSAYVITEEFTGQVFTRFRGRQIIFRVGSNQINTVWQLGAPRIDIRPDGRR